MDRATDFASKLTRLRQKQESSFTPIFLHRPLAILFLLPTADLPFVTPNLLTTLSVLLRFVVAYLILPERFGGPAESMATLIWATVLWHLGGVLDAMDGTLARYRGKGTAFGRYYDKISDRVIALCLVLALALRPFERTGDVLPLVLAMVYVSLTGTTSTAKWIEIGIRAEQGNGKGAAADPGERPAPARSFGQWVLYLLWSLRTIFVVTEMDLPLWGSLAVLFAVEPWLFYYLGAFIVPYALGTLLIRGRSIYALDRKPPVT
jgi:phosphatidylglycerophosphate synthase